MRTLLERTLRARAILHYSLPKTYNQEDGLSWLYPNEILLRPDLCIKRSFLAVLNAQVDEINDLMLDRLPGEESRSTPLSFYSVVHS
jgi:hypothetical protein